MAGNRRREEAFEIPLLMELASRSEPAESGRGRKSEDLADVRSNVLSFFPFTKEQRAKTRRKKSGREYNILDNEVDYAFLELEKFRQVTRKRTVRDRTGRRRELPQWEITAKGLDRIRTFVIRFVETRIDDAPEHLKRLIQLRNGSGPEFLILVMKCVEPRHLAAAVERSETIQDLLLESLKNTSDDSLRSLLLDFWEVIRDEFIEGNRKYYRQALAQV